MSLNYDENDAKLKQAVVDKDYRLCVSLIKDGWVSSSGIAQALYYAAAFNLDKFCELLVDEGNYSAYLNGKLVYGATMGDVDLIAECECAGADMHHNDELPLRCAVNNLHKDAVLYLQSAGCDLDVAFPKPSLQALWRTRAEGVRAGKVLDLISAAKAEANHIEMPASLTRDFKF